MLGKGLKGEVMDGFAQAELYQAPCCIGGSGQSQTALSSNKHVAEDATAAKSRFILHIHDVSQLSSGKAVNAANDYNARNAPPRMSGTSERI